ncbi:uncharacterized protein METZ01_LOCUS251247, partial [marine metagenome]
IYNNSLKIRLTSPPIDGAANKPCVKFLAKWLGVSPSRVRIVTGLSSKNKIIEINGIDESIFRDKLTAKIPNLFKELQP